MIKVFVVPRWYKVRPGMTSHRLRLQISSSSWSRKLRLTSSVLKWAPHSVIDGRALTELSAVSGGSRSPPHLSSTRLSHLWNQVLAYRYQCACFVDLRLFYNTFVFIEESSWHMWPIVIDLPSPRSPTDGVYCATALGVETPTKCFALKLQNS